MQLKFKKSAKTPAPPKAPKRKPFKASKGAKFVLFIGDEGAILIYITGNVVQSRQFVPDANAPSLDELRQTFAKDRRAPVMIVIDTIDQSYLQQTLPPVSSLSVNKLMKRRLERDFGANDIKGAILLGREKAGRKDWNFLMVSVERSPQLNSWLEFISELPNRFQGIYLVSVETEALIKHLERAIGQPQQGAPSQWKFVVSHNKVGGFRQVILRNGHIVFTRLAQPVGEATVEVLAGNIEQEILSTIEYMKRLSFSHSDGLDIYIIASSGIKSMVDKNKFHATTVTMFTPYEVAETLGIEGATQPSDQFGDVILASIIGCGSKHVLTLSVPQFKQLDTYFSLLQYQRMTAAAMVLGMVGYAGMVGFDMYNAIVKVDDQDQRKRVAQRDLDQLRVDVKNANVDVETASALIDLYNKMLEQKISPLPFIERLQSLPEDLPIWIKGVEWALDEADSKNPVPLANQKIKATVLLEFPQAAHELRVYNAVAKKVMQSFTDTFKGYELEYTSAPPKSTDSEAKSFAPGQELPVKDAALTKDMVAVTLSITGPAVPKADATPAPVVKPAGLPVASPSPLPAASR